MNYLSLRQCEKKTAQKSGIENLENQFSKQSSEVTDWRPTSKAMVHLRRVG